MVKHYRLAFLLVQPSKRQVNYSLEGNVALQPFSKRNCIDYFIEPEEDIFHS